jgi:sulfate transport system permease protein
MGAFLGRYGIRIFGLGYLLFLLLIPVVMVFFKTFEAGIGEAFEAVFSDAGTSAFWLTVTTVIISIPINAVFGVAAAIVLVRQKFRGKAFLNALIDIPFAVSPVVIGLSLILLYGPRDGFLGRWFAENGIQIIFSTPGIVLACLFVSLPFVVREVIPVLQEIGDDQEKAAFTLGANPWQTFWRITLPAIRWGVTYGVVLTTARCLGEFGAVSVVSGNLIGKTQTLTLHVNNRFQAFDLVGAYTASVVLAVLALMTLFLMNLFRKETPRVDSGSAGDQALR